MRIACKSFCRGTPLQKSCVAGSSVRPTEIWVSNRKILISQLFANVWFLEIFMKFLAFLLKFEKFSSFKPKLQSAVPIRVKHWGDDSPFKKIYNRVSRALQTETQNIVTHKIFVHLCRAMQTETFWYWMMWIILTISAKYLKKRSKNKYPNCTSFAVVCPLSHKFVQLFSFGPCQIVCYFDYFRLFCFRRQNIFS